MEFFLLGFEHDAGIRRFAFRGVADGVHTDYLVRVELALVHDCGMRIQELPEFCHALLEQQAEGAPHTLTVNATQMRSYAHDRAAAHDVLALKRKSQRRPGVSAQA